MKQHHLIQSLRNAYEAHDRPEFDRLCDLLQQRLEPVPCSRAICLCTTESAQRVCYFRSAKPQGVL